MIEMWRLRLYRKGRMAFAHRVLHPRRVSRMPADFIAWALDDERQDYVLAANDTYRQRRRIEALRS